MPVTKDNSVYTLTDSERAAFHGRENGGEGGNEQGGAFHFNFPFEIEPAIRLMVVSGVIEPAFMRGAEVRFGHFGKWVRNSRVPNSALQKGQGVSSFFLPPPAALFFIGFIVTQIRMNSNAG